MLVDLCLQAEDQVATPRQAEQRKSPRPPELYPSPFASNQIATGGWPIYLMQYVVPAPWAAFAAAAGGLKPIALGRRQSTTRSPAANSCRALAGRLFSKG